MALPKNVPPKDIPSGDLTEAIIAPMKMLAKHLPPNKQQEFSDAYGRSMSQINLLAKKQQAMEDMLRALMAQFDWTKVRP